MSLDKAIKDIEQMFGRGSIIELGDPSALVPVDVIPTGAPSLDEALGVGGLPRGRIVEIYGPEGSGKTTLLLHIIANAQKLGGRAAFIDAEHALDPIYARNLGVDVDSLLLSQPMWGEQALSIAEHLIRSGEMSVVVIDSVAALTPKAELDGEMGQQTVGAQARMMGQFMRKVAGYTNTTQTLLVLTNQIREKVGVMFGSPETTPGGRALRFYASVRLDVRRIETVGAVGEKTHNRTKVTVKKNRMAAPFRIAEFDIRFGEGIDVAGCWLDSALARGEVTKKGGWFYFANDDGELLDKVNGREAARSLIIERGLV